MNLLLLFADNFLRPQNPDFWLLFARKKCMHVWRSKWRERERVYVSADGQCMK